MARDTWATIAYPILEYAVRHFDISDDQIWTSELTAALNLEGARVQRQLKLLSDDGYLSVDARGPSIAGIESVEPKALRAVGAWPSESSVGEAVASALEQLAGDEPKPEREGALREAAKVVREVGTNVVGQVLGAAAKGAAGL